MADSIPITKPVLGQRERELILKPLETGWLVQGPYVQRFEEAFCKFSGAAHALAVSNCTTGLHLILHAMGIGPGDEVVLPSFTYIATANAVEYTGARPVFCDINPATFNLDPASLEEKITGRTRALMPVSLFGLCAPMDAVNKISQKHGLKVIEDAACALGATRNGKHAGTECDAASFSFHPRKAVTTGEGGMVTTGNKELFETMAKLRNHGAEATDLERHLSQGGSLLPAFNMLGFNYRMTDLQGALGVAQMERAAEIIAGRRAAARVYGEMLKDLEGFDPPWVPKGYEHSYQSYVVLFNGGEHPGQGNLAELNRRRNRLMGAMEKEGIAVRQGTHAVHTLGFYAEKYGIKPGDFPMSLLADRLSVTLPLFPGISREEQARVVERLSAWREID